MIDIVCETPIRLAVACGLVPPARRGKKTHISTLLRWITCGAKDPSGRLVRLEAIRLGNRWHTSREALQRFAEALTPHRPDSFPYDARTPRQRQRAAEQTDAELEEMNL
jgi:hypothetical protein